MDYMPNKGGRPVFLDLTRIYMPVNAVVSFAHRVSGVLLFLALPLVIYLLSLSLRDEQGYERTRALFDSVPLKLLALIAVWALAHHLFAGLRFLLIDLKVGIERDTFKRGAWIVNLLSVFSLLLAGGVIFL